MITPLSYAQYITCLYVIYTWSIYLMSQELCMQIAEDAKIAAKKAMLQVIQLKILLFSDIILNSFLCEFLHVFLYFRRTCQK